MDSYEILHTTRIEYQRQVKAMEEAIGTAGARTQFTELLKAFESYRNASINEAEEWAQIPF